MQIHPFSERPPRIELEEVLEETITDHALVDKKELIRELLEMMQKYNVIDHISHLNSPEGIPKGTPLDLGPKPAVINKETANDFLSNKVFLVPDSTDSKVVVEYGDFAAGFEAKGGDTLEKFGKYGINSEHFTMTLKNAEKLLEYTKGRVVKTELVLLYLTFLGGLLILLISLLLALKVSSILAFVIIGVYVVGLGFYNLYLGRKNSKLLLYAHLSLALFARSENNRIYLKHKISLRPGYLAKWIEFNLTSS